MLGRQLAHSLEVYLAAGRRHIQQEVFCKGAVLDILKDLLHRLLGLLGDDLRAGDVVAVLGGVGNGVSHACKAAHACQMSMDVMGVKQEELLDEVTVGGVATYMERADNANVNLFI